MCVSVKRLAFSTVQQSLNNKHVAVQNQFAQYTKHGGRISEEIISGSRNYVHMDHTLNTPLHLKKLKIYLCV